MTLPDSPSPSTLAWIYRTMVTIREFEERLYNLFLTEAMPGTMHQYTGQEAVAAGVCAALRPDDFITSTHRGHGHAIAKGVTLRSLMAEMFAKDTGCCRGMGGSMHLSDPAVGMLGMPLGRPPPARLGSRCLRGARGCAARGCCARPDRLRRCTLPITAFRVTPDPRRPAIWLALSPSVQSFFRSSTRSSVQDNFAPPRLLSTSSPNGIPHTSPGPLRNRRG